MVFNEYYNGRTGLTVGVKQVLFSEQSPFQKVEILETDTWGNMMTIDDMVMLSEKDEFVYHEMLAHVALLTHPDPRRVLIVGGGDGGTAREVLRHERVTHVDMVEIDEAVIRAAKAHMPGVGAFDDPRLQVHIQNGIEFVAKTTEPYDVLIIDGSDPVGPAADLFSASFLEQCHRALGPEGVLSAQTESPWVASYHPAIRQVFSSLSSIFSVSRMYLAYIPLYPAGMWSMALASKGADPLSEQVKARSVTGYSKLQSVLRYYNPDVHHAAFALPGFVRSILE
jgi:spermidine synthase